MNKTLVSSALIAGLLLTGSASMAAVSTGNSQSGMASFYHDRFHGRKTASGIRYDKNELSAAHKTLPLGTRVRVTDSRTGRDVVVRINDRGPFVKGRVIDLSRAAADQLGFMAKGVSRVKVEVLRGSENIGS
jgi:rare lipoprotein A